jgi:arsenite methyltransferase
MLSIVVRPYEQEPPKGDWNRTPFLSGLECECSSKVEPDVQVVRCGLTDTIPVDADQLRAEIQKHYAEVATSPDHEFHFHTGREAARQVGYDDAIIEDIPDDVIASFAGVANPFHFGLPMSGETVLDVGSGAGVDAIIAAKAVGPEGRVIGVDMTPEMIDAARRNSDRMGLDNVEFREGLIERLPVDAESVDLVISNGVLNLMVDKHGAYRQIERVLKPGGRFQIADICVDRPVSEETKRNIDLWTG